MVNVDPKTLPDDERMVMNLMFLKYATAVEIQNLVKPFLGEGAFVSVYEPANLLLIEDNARSMKRTMDLIALFDSDQFAGQRVRLFEVENSRPSDLQKELDQIFKAYALFGQSRGFGQIHTRGPYQYDHRGSSQSRDFYASGRLDHEVGYRGQVPLPARSTATSTGSSTRARRHTIAMAIMALYSGNPFALMALGAMASQQNMSAGNGMGGVGGMGNASAPYQMMGGMMGGGLGMGLGGYGMGGYGTGAYANPNIGAYPQNHLPASPDGGRRFRRAKIRMLRPISPAATLVTGWFPDSQLSACRT